MPETHQLLIDGGWVDARDGGVFDTLDPATGEVLASVASAGAADVDLAVTAARRADSFDKCYREISAMLRKLRETSS